MRTIQVYGFPLDVLVGEVKEFLEKKTSVGAIVALKVIRVKPLAFAIVQFRNDADPERIIKLAAKRLRWKKYGWTSYLKVRENDHDLEKPRIYLPEMEKIRLDFGCQIAPDKFSFLCRCYDVVAEFELDLRKIHFHLCYGNLEYKLELQYENIWQIKLHRPRGQASKFLVIQLYGAPRLFEKGRLVPEDDDSNFFMDTPEEQWVRTTDFTASLIGQSSGLFEKGRLAPEDSGSNYYMNTPEEQWVRTTDFTASLIGQSSGLCLELPCGLDLPIFQDHFPFYTENDEPFVLSPGSSFSKNMDLVPIINPLEVELSFDILFKVSSLVQNGYLSGPTLDPAFFRLLDPNRFDIVFIENALEKLSNLKECCYLPISWLTEQYKKFRTSRRPVRSSTISLDSGLMYVRRVQVTPCKVYFSGPEVNVSNRVLRHYRNDIDNFIRVSFIDEDWDKLHSTNLFSRASSTMGDKRTKVYMRILSTLRNGITIGSKKFELLAFSSSQLRENSAWMFASRPGLTAADIRDWMGNFRQIRNVAKYAARLGQSFGSSTETLSVHKCDTETIPDVEVENLGTKYNFSDGIGKISAEFALKVAAECDTKGIYCPSAYQIRYGGYKGVVAVDPTSPYKLSLRHSMCKYESDNTKLDVLTWSKFQPCYLNRQFITLLSTLGVPDHIFETKQKEVVDQLNSILTNPVRAHEALEMMSSGENTNILMEMLKVGYMPDVEPYLSMMLQTFRATKLLDLRTKTRIFIQDGRSMMGCLDETRTLNYGEVFIQYSAIGSDKYSYLVQGRVVVAKNPCLHPGDVRVLKAVDVPALRHMVDCVVFPQKGKRPHTNECSGSDLDGDIYFVCWDQDLIPPRQEEPMDYEPAKSALLNHDVTIEEVEEYFANYMLNDSMGIIANAHIVHADKEPNKAMSGNCIELAKLFSIAVDFPKTGVPADIPYSLRAKSYPDFMEKADKPTYESTNVIGKLFREIKDIDLHEGSISSFTNDVAINSYDTDMEYEGFEEYIEDAFYYKGNYDFKLGNLLDYYGIKTEAELLTGSIMKMSTTFNKRRDQEAVNAAVKSLRKEARAHFNENGSGVESSNDDMFAKASAWYHVTYHHSYYGVYNEGMNRDHYLSFAWCVYDKLIHIKRNKDRFRRVRNLSALDRQFRDGLSLN